MAHKLITFVDLQGRYRIMSPAYNDLARPSGETDEECRERVWAKYVKSSGSGIPIDHPRFAVDPESEKERIQELEGEYFRYPILDKNTDFENNEPKPEAIAKFGWEMDVDGRPKVNIAKARNIHMDHIRKSRNAELVKLDVPSLRAQETGDATEQAKIATEKQKLRDIPQTFDLSSKSTPKALKDTWPEELPKL